MSPPLHLIPVSELEQHVTSPQPNSPFSTNPSQRTRKNNAPPPRALTDCALKELTQYKCNAEKPKRRGEKPIVRCEPVVRLFRE
ncbi:hypothetical protein DM02DRAFT_616975 [Periconia macrospinosa]|uniref:Uncharacterized protein n=1 Tax=Periconia macrospinosa TaxID=97972 RepID=A0A2V1DFE1_9PLEO|nr:hypothetical protein DM02DRAFT_616975 [Periconia macrospinosa]